jgi:hypothetical protein
MTEALDTIEGDKLKEQEKIDKESKLHKELLDTQMKTDFGISDAMKNKNKNVSMSGDVIFKDIQLFIPELIINIALLVFGVLGIVLLRLISQGFLNDFQKYVSVQAFEMITGHVMFLQTALIIGIAVPVAFSFILFVFKWYFFYPRGKKVFVLRGWKTGLARLSVEEVKESSVKFENGEDADVMHIDNIRKSWEYNTGRPIVLLEEGLPYNTPIHRHKELNEQVKDYNNVTKSIYSTALRWAEYHVKKTQGFMSNPQNWLLLLIIAGIVVLIFFMMTKGSPTTAIEGAVAGMTARG